MCLACMEYLKGNLRDSEFRRNLQEFVDEDHDPKALEQAEIDENFFAALKNSPRQSTPKG